MKTKHLLPIVCLATTTAWGQAATTLTGQINDPAGRPVIGATTCTASRLVLLSANVTVRPVVPATSWVA